ncbi:IpaD/SipD/SspD family type III secretion system needle tip protein [Pseudomonas citri]|uniref:IpaD/SipD/SspD family type III secretion system needle tip protein n=1 Tax=Pseudomonas citri TaxID=2978349 RepID=UPI0021B69B49|nr:IpaD/SipD/SspD family type III secretion system needle tip protein [Pseudomonas citri]
MEITQFARLPVVSRPNLEAVTDTASPPDLEVEVQTVSSLAQLLDRSMNVMNRSLGHLLKCSPVTDKLLGAMATEATAQQSVVEFAEQLHVKRDRAQMWAIQVRQCCAVMAHSLETGRLDEKQRQKIADAQSQILLALKAHPEENKPLEIAEALDATINASNDFFEKLLELIELIKNGYLGVYEHIIAAYSDFFAAFNAEITAQMKDWIEGANDGKEVKISVSALRAALTSLIDRYKHPNPASVLFPTSEEGGASKEDAEEWREALGLPASCLKQNDDGTWCVVIDLGPLTIMKDSLPAGGTVTWDTAKYNQWQTGFNAQEERLKNMLQSLTQKYSNANSYHDNFNKTLSAHLNQFADMLRAMLSF